MDVVIADHDLTAEVVRLLSLELKAVKKQLRETLRRGGGGGVKDEDPDHDHDMDEDQSRTAPVLTIEDLLEASKESLSRKHLEAVKQQLLTSEQKRDDLRDDLRHLDIIHRSCDTTLHETTHRYESEIVSLKDRLRSCEEEREEMREVVEEMKSRMREAESTHEKEIGEYKSWSKSLASASASAANKAGNNTSEKAEQLRLCRIENDSLRDKLFSAGQMISKVQDDYYALLQKDDRTIRELRNKLHATETLLVTQARQLDQLRASISISTTRTKRTSPSSSHPSSNTSSPTSISSSHPYSHKTLSLSHKTALPHSHSNSNTNSTFGPWMLPSSRPGSSSSSREPSPGPFSSLHNVNRDLGLGSTGRTVLPPIKRLRDLDSLTIGMGMGMGPMKGNKQIRRD